MVRYARWALRAREGARDDCALDKLDSARISACCSEPSVSCIAASCVAVLPDACARRRAGA